MPSQMHIPVHVSVSPIYIHVYDLVETRNAAEPYD